MTANCTCHVTGKAKTSSASCPAHNWRPEASGLPCCADGICPQHAEQAIEDMKEKEVLAFGSRGVKTPRLRDLMEAR